jgi:CPA2 family monovalent cation:H+ antiporter-2
MVGHHKLPKNLPISVIMVSKGWTMELQFLKTLVIIFGASAFVVFLLQKLKVPSIEIFAKVLHHYQVPKNLMSEQIEKIRSRSYEVLRRMELPAKNLPEKCEILIDIDTETYLINDRSRASGRSIKELRIRSTTGATVIAVKRGNEMIPSPGLDFVFAPGDILYLIGNKESLAKAFGSLES